MATDFLSEVERRLADYRREDAALAAQEEGVRRKRGDVRQRIAEMEATIRVYRDVMDLPAGQTPIIGLFEDVQLGTIGNMAAEIIGKRGEPMKVADIARVLEAFGKLRPESEGGRGNYGTVYGTLSRDRRFRKAGTGAFGLVVVEPKSGHPSEPEQPAALSLTAAQP